MERSKRTETIEKISGVLTWVGAVGAALSGIVYIIVTYIIVKGFQTNFDLQRQIFFAIIGAVAGLAIASFLKIQGITLAKKIPENEKVMREYYEIKNKDKKEKELHTIERYLVISTIKDVAFKGISIAFTSFAIIYIAIEGQGDMMLFALALSNLTMFIGFGFMSMAKAFDKYNLDHISAIKRKIEILKEVKENGIQEHQVATDATTSREE